MRTLLVLALILFSSTAFAKPKHHPHKRATQTQKLDAEVKRYEKRLLDLERQKRNVIFIKADPAPKILKQRSGGMPDRVLITVRNPLSRPVWVYLECPNSLTETPVGIPGRTTADVNLACGIEPGGICLLNHWRLQDGHEPPQWTP